MPLSVLGTRTPISCYRDGMAARLLLTLKLIHASGLLAAAFVEAGRLHVWLGDDTGGVLGRAAFDGGALDEANAWLEQQVVLAYPRSALLASSACSQTRSVTPRATDNRGAARARAAQLADPRSWRGPYRLL